MVNCCIVLIGAISLSSLSVALSCSCSGSLFCMVNCYIVFITTMALSLLSLSLSRIPAWAVGGTPWSPLSCDASPCQASVGRPFVACFRPQSRRSKNPPVSWHLSHTALGGPPSLLQPVSGDRTWWSRLLTWWRRDVSWRETAENDSERRYRCSTKSGTRPRVIRPARVSCWEGLLTY